MIYYKLLKINILIFFYIYFFNNIIFKFIYNMNIDPTNTSYISNNKYKDPEL